MKSFWRSLADIFRILSARRRRELVIVLLLMLATGAAELGTIGMVLPMLSQLLNGRQTVATVLDWLPAEIGPSGTIFLFIALVVVAGALRLQLLWLTQSLTFGAGHELSTEIDRRILDQPYAFHLGSDSSQLIAALEKVQVLIFGVLTPLMQMVTGTIVCLFILVATLAIDPVAGAIAIAGFGTIYFVILLLSRHRLRANAVVVGSVYDARIKIIQESLGGIRDIVIDGSQEVFVDAFRRVDQRLMAAISTSSLIAAVPRTLIETFGVILMVVLAAMLSSRPDHAASAVPLLGAIALGCQRLLPYAQQVFSGWAQITGNSVIVRQVLHLVSLPLRTSRGAEPLPFRRFIKLEHVDFTYTAPPTEALKDISLTIPRGALVGLTGRSGSGKSTFADLLMGLLEPSRGTVTVDGVELNEETRPRWWRSIAHVPQSIFFANDTIARNIAFGVPEEEIDLARVAEAARKAELAGYVEQLPDGYQTMVGERGKAMSGGQQQRLGLARAIYKGARLLVLDEPTSALDRETEAAVFETIAQLRRDGTTIVLITHRPSALRHCSMVVRLDKGRVVDVV